MNRERGVPNRGRRTGIGTELALSCTVGSGAARHGTVSRDCSVGHFSPSVARYCALNIPLAGNAPALAVDESCVTTPDCHMAATKPLRRLKLDREATGDWQDGPSALKSSDRASQYLVEVTQELPGEQTHHGWPEQRSRACHRGRR